MGMGWPLWVFGWGLLVGGAVFALPSYFAFGVTVATWVSGVVAALSLLLAWMSAEAGRALNASVERAPEPGMAERVANAE